MIFDEAQRAWDLKQTASFMKQKRRNSPGFSQSEPEFLLSRVWTVMRIGLSSSVYQVGGGQEINIGEAGIDAWIEAVNARFPHWSLHISRRLTDSEYAAGGALGRSARPAIECQFDDDLHPPVSMRSFRAENVVIG